MGTRKTSDDVERNRRLRQTQKALRNDSPPSPCELCGYYSAAFGLLRPFRVSELAGPLKQKVLQRHHVDGEEASDFRVWLCVWCHLDESAAQYDLDPRLRHPRTEVERLLALIAGDARLLRRWGEVLQSRGDWLAQEVREILASIGEDGNG